MSDGISLVVLQVIKNLSKALDRQKEKMEAMRAFTTWRIQHSQVKEEVAAGREPLLDNTLLLNVSF